MRREGGLANPIVYYLIGAFVQVIAQAVWQGVGFAMPGMGGSYAGAGFISAGR